MVKDKNKPKETAEEHEEDISEFFTKRKEDLGEMTQRSGSGRYAKIVSAIAILPKGSYEINLNKLNLPLKSVYPSLEKCIQALAKINGVDFSITKETKRQIKGEEKTIVSYPKFIEWKNTVGMRVRTDNKKLYLQKLSDQHFKPLTVEEE
ncbi:MAG: hypothetical protein ABR962_10485 [Candidatus Bathyarchaeia archaeon]